MASLGPCFSRGRLLDHLHGLASDPDDTQLIAHLDTCKVCQSTLDELAGDSQLVEVARNSRRQSSSFDAVLERLLVDLQRRSGESLPALANDYLEPPTNPGTLGRLAHFHVLEVAGRGGMGIALKAIDEKLDRLTCLKVFTLPISGQSVLERIQREARAAAAIESEHVVRIYSSGEHHGRPYLAMEFVRGRSLQEELDRRGPLPLDDVLQIGADVASGLVAAHAKGLIHRDIKPGNILLEEGTGRAKITDFGMARALDDGRLTAEGCIAGTPEYMSPEQVRGESVDHRADLFSLGSVLYAMCTGRSPFATDSSLASLRRILDDAPLPVQRLRPDVPPWLIRLIARLHAKSATARPQSAEEVLHSLACHNPPTGFRVRASRRAAILAGGAMLLGGTSLVTLLRRRNLDQDTPGAEPAPAGNSPLLINVGGPQRSPQLLIVLASGFEATDYFGVYGQLRAKQVRCQVASTTLEPVRSRNSNLPTPVQPDLLIGDAEATDFGAVFFAGGEGCEVYARNGSHAIEAGKLIEEALAAERIVAAMGIGPVVLAEAGVLQGRKATCSPYGVPTGVYVDRLKSAGARWQDVPVVEDGPFITGREPRDVNQFIQVLGRRLMALPKDVP